MNSRSDMYFLVPMDDNSELIRQKQEFKELTEQLQFQIDQKQLKYEEVQASLV